MSVELSDPQLLVLLYYKKKFALFTDGFALEDYSVLGYDDSLKDEDFEIGDTFTKTSPHFHRRIVSLAVYIA